MNTKVNNWAVEISPFKITFEYIKGIKNTLADTMSRLIALDADNQLVAELEGFEYGYYAFDNIDPIETQVDINEMVNRKEGEAPVNLPDEEVILPIGNNKLTELQKEDKFCKTFSICWQVISCIIKTCTTFRMESSKGTLMTRSKDLRLLYHLKL